MYNSYLHTELMAFTLGPTNCLILGPKENRCVINVSSQEQFPALEAADIICGSREHEEANPLITDNIIK